MSPSKLSSIKHRVLDFIRVNNLVQKHDNIVVAVSGGPDSVCLLHLLINLQHELPLNLHIAHLNHQIREAEADADAEYVADLSRRFSIPATIEKRNVLAYQVESHLSLEEAAREMRYNFLVDVAKDVDAMQVAVGHTSDDHVETVLMHLIRGSGLNGLRGLRPINRWYYMGYGLTVIRPLLVINHKDTISYCHQHHLMPRTDMSNLSMSGLRNQIRLQLIPILQKYNPKINSALHRTSRIVSKDLDFIDNQIAHLSGDLIQKQGNTIVIPKDKLAKLPSSLQYHLLLMVIKEMLGTLKNINSYHIEEMAAILSKPAGRSVNLPSGLIFLVDYDKYIVSGEPTNLCPFPPLKGEFQLTIPGKTRLPGWQVEASIINRKEINTEDVFTAYFDLAKVKNRLLVRHRRPGDRFIPLGMNSLKKVGIFMIDARIPRIWRERVPIVCSPEQILWLVGYRIDERVKIDDDTQQMLCLKMRKMEVD